MEKLILVLQQFKTGRMITPNCEGHAAKITGIKYNKFNHILLKDESGKWWFETDCSTVGMNIYEVGNCFIAAFSAAEAVKVWEEDKEAKFDGLESELQPFEEGEIDLPEWAFLKNKLTDSAEAYIIDTF